MQTHYKIYYRLVNALSTSMKLEFNTAADNAEHAKDKLKELCSNNEFIILEVYARIEYYPETIVKPEDI